jgi:hypothetical protein
MSQPFFRNDERRAALIFAAHKWKETPWRANSAAQGKQGGVSCHNLPRAIYISCGALQETFPVLSESPNNATGKSIIAPFIDSRREFLRLNEGDTLQAGDLIGLWLARDHNGKMVRTRHANHLGIVLDKFWFIHVLMAPKNTGFDMHSVPPWVERIVAAWRPVE